MLTAISRYGARVLPNTEQLVAGCKARGEFIQGPQIAQFEAALQEPERLERFEAVVRVESMEPLPLAAWHAWPRLEGVMAEAYEEPIAPRKVAARPEWVELMRSLREDIARRRAELNSPAQAAQVAHTAPAAPSPPRNRPRRPRARSRPVRLTPTRRRT